LQYRHSEGLPLQWNDHHEEPTPLSAQNLLTPLIAALKQAIPMEVRAAPATGEYLEGVLSRPDLPRCCDLLVQHLGSSVKEFAQPAKFSKEIQRLVNDLGGVRVEQSLFLKTVEGSQTIYAALWPWASNPLRITLKVGLHGQP